MAIPFLNNIDLSDNQLLNAKLHITGTTPTASSGQIYFDSSENLAKYYSNGTDTWVSLKQYSFGNGTFVNLSTSGTTAKPTITADLSATGTKDATTYLRGDNTWSPISAIPGTYTFDVSADVGVTQTIDSGETLNIVGGTYITTGIAATDTVAIIHDATPRTDTTSTDTPAFGGTFEAVTSVTTNSTGHVTAIDVSTITIPSSPTITLTGEVTGSGTTSITTTVSDGVLDVANFNASAIVTEAEGIESNDNDTTIPTSAAVKDYVDSAVVGGLVYQGGYNAATNTPDLDISPSASIKKGWTYTVTTDGLFFTEQVRVGDVIIAEVDAPTTLADWTTVQNNIDIASASQIGIGNVAASTADQLLGVDVTYNGLGTAAVGLDIHGLPNISNISSADLASLEIPLYNNDTTNSNEKVEIFELLSLAGKLTSYATTITDTATVNHGLGTKDIIVQLYDTVTNETVYADVERISTEQVTITFSTTPTNSIRVLIQKIG